ncbi:MAG: family metalloprotease domain protein [Polaromonas sp.]|nr:family metalloprotease domain protein [Polaromonas sp.]
MQKEIKMTWAALAALFLSLCLAAPKMAHAMPASPMPIQVVQPDGTTIQAVMRGDEFQGWMETSDGYTIVKNSFSGFYEFAQQSFSGQLVPSGFVVSAAVQAQIAARGLMPLKRLRPPSHADLQKYQENFLNAAQAARLQNGLYQSAAAPLPSGIWAPVPVSGFKKMLLILVNFQDSKLSFGAANYWSNAVHNATGASVARYYQDNSLNALSIVPTPHQQPGSPAGVVTVSLPQNHPNYGNNFPYAVESAWINSALAAAAPYVNFPALDTNGDGTIGVDETVIYFIVAGYEASSGNGTPSIWAHAWGGPNVGVNGKMVEHWALNGEMYNASSRLSMGVIAHEMGHAMGGLPDLHDISGKNGGLGIFSLMAFGGWGARSGEAVGTTPVNLDAWSRQYLGWSSPQTPTGNATMSFASPLSSRSASVMLMNSASTTSEYWLVENRPPVGWDAGMYGILGGWTGGLLIQHIDLNVGSKSANSFNAYVSGGHQGNMAVEPSTADCSMVSANSWGCQKILFYAGNSTAFNARSTPQSNYYSGSASSLGISSISAAGNTMTAAVQVVGGDQLQAATKEAAIFSYLVFYDLRSSLKTNK